MARTRTTLFGDDAAGLPAARPDRRAAPRLDKAFPVFVEGDGGAGLGIARNVSEGGMFIELRDPQPLGSQVRVLFPARDGEMTAVAEVRFVCHLMGRVGERQGGTRVAAVRGMGVRFLYFEPGDAHHGVVH